jgi:5-methylcytosine-specific restriction endonuclease McrA
MADALKCVYCGAMMGKVQLTVDHFIPLEMGGANDTSNYLSACRKCNKDKGAMDPRDFCEWRNLNYEVLVDYLARRKVA